jgi:hypothetical protein
VLELRLAAEHGMIATIRIPASVVEEE